MKKWTVNHFSQATPNEPQQPGVPRPLRRVAKTIDGLGPVGGTASGSSYSFALRMLLHSGGVECGVGAAVVLWGPGPPALEGGVTELPSVAVRCSCSKAPGCGRT